MMHEKIRLRVALEFLGLLTLALALAALPYLRDDGGAFSIAIASGLAPVLQTIVSRRMDVERARHGLDGYEGQDFEDYLVSVAPLTLPVAVTLWLLAAGHGL